MTFKFVLYECALLSLITGGFFFFGSLSINYENFPSKHARSDLHMLSHAGNKILAKRIFIINRRLKSIRSEGPISRSNLTARVLIDVNQ